MVNLDKPAGEIRLREVSAVGKEITTFIATEDHDLFSNQAAVIVSLSKFDNGGQNCELYHY